MFKLLTGASAILATVFFGKKLIGDAVGKVWENVSFSRVPKTFKVKLGFTSVVISSSLKIANNNNLTIVVKGLSAIIKIKDADGNMVEVGRTPPSNKVWNITAKESTIVEGISVKVGFLKGFKAVKSALEKPEGERLMINFSGRVNGFPLNYDFWM